MLKAPSELLRVDHKEAVHAEIEEEYRRKSEMLEAAAALSPRLRSLRLTGFGTQQPELIISILAVLPAAGLARLSIDGRCMGPLPAALLRFPQLASVSIAGDASGVSWAGRGGARLAGMVERLKLAPSGFEQTDFGTSDKVRSLPRGLAAGLAAATRVIRMELMCRWEDPELGVPAVCASLPALCSLR